MSKNESQRAKPISKKRFTFFGGIFFCLLSVSLIVNYGVATKIATWVPTYLFGAGAFIIYVLLYVVGLYLIFKEETFKVRFNQYFIGGLIVFLSLILGLTLGFSYKGVNTISAEKYIAAFNHCNGGSNYINDSIVNLFNPIQYLDPADSNSMLSYQFGGGYLGNLFAELLLNNAGLSIQLVWGITVLLFVIGGVIMFSKQIFALVFKNVEPKKKKEKVQKVKKEKKVVETPNTYEFNDTRPEVVTSKPIIEEQPVQEQAKVQSQLNLGPTIEQYIGSGTFVQARFVRSVDNSNQVNQTPIVEEVSSQPIQEQSSFTSPIFSGFSNPSFAQPAYSQPVSEPVQNPTVQEPIAPIQQENVPEHYEQGDIFQESKPVINESIVGAKTEFEERKAINNPAFVQPAPAPVVQPTVVKEETVRKPIKWVPPSADLLEDYEVSQAIKANEEVASERALAIDQLFTDFNIGAHVEDYTIGPSVTRFNIRCNKDVSVQAISKKVDDISIRLNGLGCRFTPIVEGQSTSGLEVPNAKVTTVSFKDVFTQLPSVKESALAVPFGKNIKGDVVSADFGQFPHLLVAGTTGSGKSIYVHSIIASLIMRNSPENLKVFIVDPKGNEMAVYRDIPHLLCPIVNEAHKAKMVLSKLCDEMNDRYRMFETADFASDLKDYNKWAVEHGVPVKPYIVCIIDEYADLVENCKEISSPVVQIGQKARAAGIHLLIATQRPSTNVVTGTIKANLPTHVALTTGSSIDSITIIGEGGAEKLLGKGDMLVQSSLISKNGAVRLQGCYVSKKELSRVCNYLKDHYETIYEEKYMNLDENAQNAGKMAAMSGQIQQGSTDDADEAKYQSIKEWVMSMQFVSMSRIQGECGVGFNRARRIFSRLQQEGVVGYDNIANKGCPVLQRDGGCEVDTDSIPVSSQTSHIG